MRLLITACTALCLFASNAWAEDFTVQVPVRIENMPHLTAAHVNCNAVTATHGSAGSGLTNVPLTAGGYNGTLTVAFNAAAGHSRIEATSISCDLQATIRAADGHTVDSGYMALPGSYTTLTGQAVATYSPGGSVAIPH